ncbi:MAG: site-specific integrase [Planctomycetes bacterium]|nr:site-specific integrase [Planctomycetota bacterium]
MDMEEVNQLRMITEAGAIVDLKKGRVKGPLAWMVIDLALSTGLRVSEMAALKLKDIDLKRDSISVVRLKRKKKAKESLALSKEVVRHLSDFIKWKKTVGQVTKPASVLFAGSRGALTAQGLQRIWKAAVKRAGLPKELSIHCARHTIAVQLLKKTGNLRQVQKQLGHASPATTANMYADISFEDMQKGLNGLYDN